MSRQFLYNVDFIIYAMALELPLLTIMTQNSLVMMNILAPELTKVVQMSAASIMSHIRPKLWHEKKTRPRPSSWKIERPIIYWKNISTTIDYQDQNQI